MTFKSSIKGICIILLPLFVLCGPYSFSGSSIPGHIKSVAIPLFEDRTAEFGVKEKITDSLIDEFIKENILQVRDKKDADSIIEGVITKVTDRPYTYDENEEVQEYRVNIYVDLTWVDKKKNEALFEGNVIGWGTYSASSPEQREDGLEAAVERLVTEILNQTLSGW